MTLNMKKIIAVALLAIMFSCQPAKETTSEPATSADFTKERNAFFNGLKAPGEVAAQLEATGAEFTPSLMSDPGKSLSYRSEEHTSELQSQSNLVCRLLLEKKKK